MEEKNMFDIGDSKYFKISDKSDDIQTKIKKNLNKGDVETIVCPHCGSGDFVKYGVTQANKQRYLCNSCKKTFIGNTNTVFNKSKLDVSVWLKAEKYLSEGMSLRKMAKELGVSLKTCQSLKRKINALKDE